MDEDGIHKSTMFHTAWLMHRSTINVYEVLQAAYILTGEALLLQTELYNIYRSCFYELEVNQKPYSCIPLPPTPAPTVPPPVPTPAPISVPTVAATAPPAPTLAPTPTVVPTLSATVLPTPNSEGTIYTQWNVMLTNSDHGVVTPDVILGSTELVKIVDYWNVACDID